MLYTAGQWAQHDKLERSYNYLKVRLSSLKHTLFRNLFVNIKY